jgi:HSP20 family protein
VLGALAYVLALNRVGIRLDQTAAASQQHAIATDRALPNQQRGVVVAEIEQVIHNLGRLYQVLTGRNISMVEGEGHEFPIPPEKTVDQHLDEQLDRMLSVLNVHPMAWLTGRAQAWTPACSMAESANEIRISVDLPGVSRDDLKLSVDRSTLIVEGARKLPVNGNNNGEHIRHVEQPHGAFRRQIALPEGIAQDRLSARMTDGVLEIRVPRATAETTARMISVG